MKSLTENAVLASLMVSCWSARKVDKETGAVVARDNEADEDAGQYVKQLLPKDVLRDVMKLGSAARDLHRWLTMPWSSEYRIMPVELYDNYRSRMDNILEERIKARQKVLDHWDMYLKMARPRMGKLFRESEYPSAYELGQRIFAEYSFSPVPTGDHFAALVDENAAALIRKDIEAKITMRIENATFDLFSRLKVTVQHVHERLQPTEDGKDKVLRNTMLTNLQDLVGVLPALNLTGDPVLAETVEELRQCVDGLTPDHLRRQSDRFSPNRRADLDTLTGQLSDRFVGYFSTPEGSNAGV